MTVTRERLRLDRPLRLAVCLWQLTACDAWPPATPVSKLQSPERPETSTARVRGTRLRPRPEVSPATRAVSKARTLLRSVPAATVPATGGSSAGSGAYGQRPLGRAPRQFERLDWAMRFGKLRDSWSVWDYSPSSALRCSPPPAAQPRHASSRYAPISCWRATPTSSRRTCHAMPRSRACCAHTR